MKFMVLTSAAFTLGQIWIGAQNWYQRGSADHSADRSIDDVAVGSAIGVTYPDEHDAVCWSVDDEQLCAQSGCTSLVRRDHATSRHHCPCQRAFRLQWGADRRAPRRPLARIVLDMRGRDLAIGVEERTT